jgi:hypothetical protein
MSIEEGYERNITPGEPAPEVRFVRGTAGSTSFLTIRHTLRSALVLHGNEALRAPHVGDRSYLPEASAQVTTHELQPSQYACFLSGGR